MDKPKSDIQLQLGFLGITQNKICDISNVKKPQVSQILSGIYPYPNNETYQKVMKTTGKLIKAAEKKLTPSEKEKYLALINRKIAS